MERLESGNKTMPSSRGQNGSTSCTKGLSFIYGELNQQSLACQMELSVMYITIDQLAVGFGKVGGDPRPN
jgi:hypothetical protein